MPELPEVESVRKYLEKSLKGRRILQIEHRFPGILSTPPQAPSPLLPVRFVNADRKGKMLILRFDKDQTLLIHLRMTGRLYFPVSAKDLLPHTHVLFILDRGQHLAYSDPRRFGRLIWFVGRSDDDIRELRALGPDALSVSEEGFAHLLRTRNRMIKPLLLDQSILSGLGNIYVDETLFLARIHPKQISSNLSGKKLARLWAATQQILESAIENGGSTIRDFVGSSGKAGGYQQYHSVYGRGGLGCVQCGQTLRKVLVAQRGTTYCPKCQRLQYRTKVRSFKRR